jgi:hypothetical protein
MGLFDVFRRGTPKSSKAFTQPEPLEHKSKETVYVGAKNDEMERKDYQSYNN